jgi:hypothetical protein
MFNLEEQELDQIYSSACKARTARLSARLGLSSLGSAYFHEGNIAQWAYALPEQPERKG